MVLLAAQGRALSLWPIFDRREGRLNYVAGDRLVAMRIFSAILIRRKEDYIHPNHGRAPIDIFVPLSQDEPMLLVHEIEDILQAQVGDCLSYLNVRTFGYTAIEPGVPPLTNSPITSGARGVSPTNNKLTIEVDFTRKGGTQVNQLIFPFWKYEGSPLNANSLGSVIRDVTLNGKPFFGLNDSAN